MLQGHHRQHPTFLALLQPLLQKGAVAYLRIISPSGTAEVDFLFHKIKYATHGSSVETLHCCSGNRLSGHDHLLDDHVHQLDDHVYIKFDLVTFYSESR